MTFFIILLFLIALGILLLFMRILLSVHKDVFNENTYEDAQYDRRTALSLGTIFGIFFGVFLGAMQADMLYAHMPLFQKISKVGMLLVCFVYITSALTSRDISLYISAWTVGCCFLLAIVIGEMVANGTTLLLLVALLLLIGKLVYGAKKILQS